MPAPPAATTWPWDFQGVFSGCNTNLAAALDSLMWIVQIDYNGFSAGLTIRGYIKPRLFAFTEGEVLAGFTEDLEEILDVIDQAGFALASFPDVHVGDRDGLEMRVCLDIREIP